MSEGTRSALLIEARPGDRFAEHVKSAAERASPENQLEAGLEALVAMAESDPAAARVALHQFRTDQLCLSRLEAWLGGNPHRTTFGLGAAMRLVDAELTSSDPNLRALLPDLLRWLRGDW